MIDGRAMKVVSWYVTISDSRKIRSNFWRAVIFWQYFGIVWFWQLWHLVWQFKLVQHWQLSIFWHLDIRYLLDSCHILTDATFRQLRLIRQLSHFIYFLTAVTLLKFRHSSLFWQLSILWGRNPQICTHEHFKKCLYFTVSFENVPKTTKISRLEKNINLNPAEFHGVQLAKYIQIDFVEINYLKGLSR